MYTKVYPLKKKENPINVEIFYIKNNNNVIFFEIIINFILNIK